MIKPDIQIRGIHESIIALNKMAQIDTINVRLGMEECAKVIYDKSQELVPVDTEALKKSGIVGVERTGLNAVIVVQYGGESAPYAWIVHEDPTKFHNPPTQDHYLSDAIMLTKFECERIMNRHMRNFQYQGTSTNLSHPSEDLVKVI